MWQAHLYFSLNTAVHSTGLLPVDYLVEVKLSLITLLILHSLWSLIRQLRAEYFSLKFCFMVNLFGQRVVVKSI